MKRTVICSAVVLAAMTMGCGSKDDTMKVSTPAAPQTATPAMPAMPQTAADKMAVPDTSKAADTAAGVSADTQAKLDQITGYIKDKKYDLAEKALSELEANKASLPASVQGQLGNLRTALNAAKASGGMGGMSMPAMPK